MPRQTVRLIPLEKTSGAVTLCSIVMGIAGTVKSVLGVSSGSDQRGKREKKEGKNERSRGINTRRIKRMEVTFKDEYRAHWISW